jgi:hypothetical protein
VADGSAPGDSDAVGSAVVDWVGVRCEVTLRVGVYEGV